ncbi:hypothetical protein E2986_13623 [Frieseomelitta varia]|uniref:H15 domain-containing protein n=1 Tax=Frieseomelitta varia TaxID=561572 RepID=A0A833RRL8_9HYME|nr:hypothetical protein E2986_13623 [Frieseomelitta varia]
MAVRRKNFNDLRLSGHPVYFTIALQWPLGFETFATLRPTNFGSSTDEKVLLWQNILCPLQKRSSSSLVMSYCRVLTVCSAGEFCFTQEEIVCVDEMEDKSHVENTIFENESDPAKKTAKFHSPTFRMAHDRRGSSIKKHIAYEVDVLFIKRYPKTAISSGTVVQIRGEGASGSFKLSTIGRSMSRKTRRIKVPIMKKAEKSVETEATAPERRKPASRKLGFAKRFDKKSAATRRYLLGRSVKATVKRSRKAKRTIESKTKSKEQRLKCW